MGPSDLKVLQAAAQVLREERPERNSVKVLTEYAAANIPERAGLPPDELATFVALKLMDVPGDLK